MRRAHSLKIAAGEFKAKCLQLMDEVKETHVVITITKHGIPVAKLVPIDDEAPITLFGAQCGSISIHGDIISPIDAEWDSNE